MQEKDRKIYFTLNVIAIFFIVVIVYFAYKFEIYIHKPTEGSPSFFPYFVNMISAFLCCLLLQGEEILKISRQRNSLFIRWDLIILGIIAFLLGFIQFWFYLLFPHFQFGETKFGFIDKIVAIIMVGNFLDIAYMCAAGMFFIRAFHVQDSLMEKKDRIISFTINTIVVPLLVVVVYILAFIVGYIFTSSSVPDYIRDYVPYIGIFFTLV